MIRVRVEFETQLRAASGMNELVVELNDQSTVADALKNVGHRLGSDVQDRLLLSDDRPQSGLLLFVNERPVGHHLAGSYKLSEGDTLLLYPPISGG